MKTPVERLRDDLLFKALTSGTATQDDARDAAKWIERLTALLTDKQDRLMQDGFDAGDDPNPEWMGKKLAAMGVAMRERIAVLSNELSMCSKANDVHRITDEIRALAECFSWIKRSVDQ